MATLPQIENSLSSIEPEQIGKKVRRNKANEPGILPHLRDLIDNCGRGRKYAETLDQLAIRSKSETVRLAAIQEIADRIHGKAVQSIRHAGVFMVMAPGAEALQALDTWAEDE